MYGGKGNAILVEGVKTKRAAKQAVSNEYGGINSKTPHRLALIFEKPPAWAETGRHSLTAKRVYGKKKPTFAVNVK